MAETIPDDQPTAHVTSELRFAIIPEWIVLHEELTATAVRVFAVLARHGADPSNCYPSHKRIGTMARIAEKSVARPIAELVATGAIAITPRYDTDGRQTSNGYHLAGAAPLVTALRNNPPPLENDPQPPHLKGGRPPHLKGGPPPLRSGTKESKKEREQVEREQVERESARAAPPLTLVVEQEPAPDPFDEWWTLYPRKLNKDGARTSYAKAIKRAAAAEILDGLRPWAAYWQARAEPEFVPHATTWLNQGRWDAPPPTAKDKPRSAGDMVTNAPRLDPALIRKMGGQA